MNITVRKAEQRRPMPEGTSLGFGRYFTDHMFIMEFDRQRGWHDQRIVPYGPLSLDPAAAVLHYAQEAFEGLKAWRTDNGRVHLFRPDRHCQRFLTTTERLCIPSVTPDLMMNAVMKFISIERDWVPSAPSASLYIRPAIIATEPFLGVRPADTYLFYLIACPVGAYYAEGFEPVRIWVEDEFVRAAAGGLGAAKTGANYVASLYASERAKKNGYSQVLWLDAKEHRYFEEVGTMNLFVQIRDTLITPPLGGSILAGVTRESIITLLKEWGVPVEERPLAIDEVVAAHGRGELNDVFGCGTGAIISPVGELGWKGGRMSINNGRAGEIAKKLFDTITAIQRGRMPDKHGWLVEVPEEA
ncbi:branched-chain amino acid aminotransferase [Sorangium sp. So ce1182]|uniref:branched-chain amino acid aminotransferase n=1 Tax=Sorangium sp. So ce1182 TaxID=3133334 RepID=UPI003F63389D